MISPSSFIYAVSFEMTGMSVGWAVGVVFAAARVKAVAAFHGFRLVVHLIAVVELLGVKFARTCYGVGAVEAFDGACLVLAGIAPGIGLSQFRCGVTGFPSLSSSILYSSLPP